MNDKDIFVNFCKTIFIKLAREVNGNIQYQHYMSNDMVIFKIVHKDFKYDYVITNVSTHIYDGDSDMVVNDIVDTYRKAILKCFFTSKERKEQFDMRRKGGSF